MIKQNLSINIEEDQKLPIEKKYILEIGIFGEDEIESKHLMAIIENDHQDTNVKIKESSNLKKVQDTFLAQKSTIDNLPNNKIDKEQEMQFIAFKELERENPEYFQSLQKWEGYVIEVFNDHFSARICDLTNNNDDEYVELTLNELLKEDLDLLIPGAVFYWNIGYRDDKYGTRHRDSIIRFRRLPAFGNKEIEDAKNEAEILFKIMSYTNEEGSKLK